MTLSIWRISHLILALSAAIFILIASVTGAILAFEPISNKLKPYAVSQAKELSISEMISVLKQNYEEVIEVEIDANDFVKVTAINEQFESGSFYINPFTGKNIGNTIEKAPLFEFATNLHRSLFLKSTGRFLIGLASLLLILIAVTGIKLIAKRQGGFKRWFSKVIREDFQQYYHVVLGRYTLIPILIISVTGVFLSLERFSLLPKSETSHQTIETTLNLEKRAVLDFEIFKSTTLENVKRIEFPFSDDEEDYFIVALKDAEIWVNQYSGTVISKADQSLTAYLLDWSIVLHTGNGTIIWSIVLLLSCLALLFFVYSGFAMTLKRRKKQSIFKNSFTKDNAEFIVLIGSETGHTFSFAKYFSEALIEAGKSVFVDALDNYKTYKSAQQLVIFTSTYGEGDAPGNAKKFQTKFETIEQEQTLNYSIVGFGSLLYPDYCKFAIDIDALLANNSKFTSSLPLFKINNQSFEAFKTWTKQWNNVNGLDIKLKPQVVVKPKGLKQFSVVHKTALNIDDTFLIELQPSKKAKFKSGDLLAFYPNDDHVERLYSIGKVSDNILLSIKKHEFGVCSNYLNNLTDGQTITTKIKRNLDFHFPTYVKEVIMIANGTGIAPFLGMIGENKGATKAHLFWGGRTKASFDIYADYIDEALVNQKLSSFCSAYSQEQADKIYVQDVIEQHVELFLEVLQNNGIIMICGAIAMQNRVLEILNTLTQNHLNQPLSDFENNAQIKMDCY